MYDDDDDVASTIHVRTDKGRRMFSSRATNVRNRVIVYYFLYFLVVVVAFMSDVFYLKNSY